MDHPRFQMSVAVLLGVVAGVALNLWLFRLGMLWGFLGLSVTKHVLTAYLCQVLGVDRNPRSPTRTGPHVVTAESAPTVTSTP